MIDQTAIAAAIEALQDRYMTVSMCITSTECKAHNRAIDTALAALRECAERRENKPLTLDELHQRNRKPVWIESEREGDMWSFCVTHKGYVKVIDHYGSDYGLQESDYGKRWLAYDHERGDT